MMRRWRPGYPRLTIKMIPTFSSTKDLVSRTMFTFQITPLTRQTECETIHSATPNLYNRVDCNIIFLYLQSAICISYHSLLFLKVKVPLLDLARLPSKYDFISSIFSLLLFSPLNLLQSWLGDKDLSSYINQDNGAFYLKNI